MLLGWRTTTSSSGGPNTCTVVPAEPETGPDLQGTARHDQGICSLEGIHAVPDPLTWHVAAEATAAVAVMFAKPSQQPPAEPVA